ncbi:MAG: membrane dipeptidase [Saprospiraceae bacterium]
MFIVDAHLDLSMNAMEWNRDLTLPIDSIRNREKNQTDKPDRGHNMVSLPELRKANIGIVVATLIARFIEESNPLSGWHSPEQAWAQTQGQLAWYISMEQKGEMEMIKTKDDLSNQIHYWLDEKQETNQKKIGFILSLEGADSIVNLDYLHAAHQNGLRAIGPAHYGPGRYANGTDATGRLNEMGKSLLHEMNSLNMILDVTHLCDDAFWDALEIYSGPIWASHNNCRTLVNHNRQFSDDQIIALIERNAIIGGVMDAWMIVPDWKRGISKADDLNCNLERLVDHMVHICTLAGNVHHIGIGSDLDGAFGYEQCPSDLNTIADLQLLIDIFSKRGFTEEEIKKIMHQNWIDFLSIHLPASLE